MSCLLLACKLMLEIGSASIIQRWDGTEAEKEWVSWAELVIRLGEEGALDIATHRSVPMKRLELLSDKVIRPFSLYAQTHWI